MCVYLTIKNPRKCLHSKIYENIPHSKGKVIKVNVYLALRSLKRRPQLAVVFENNASNGYHKGVPTLNPFQKKGNRPKRLSHLMVTPSKLF